MTPVVDIIDAVVSSMKPVISSLSYSISGTAINFTTTDRGILRRLFTYERVKVTACGVVYYGYIDTITEWTSFRAVFASLPAGTTTVTGAALVINYHHGHPLEIVNLFKQATHLESVKFEQFPAVCLLQDFPEKFEGVNRDVELNIIIVTDTERSYQAAERYRATFKPILYPLCDMFLNALIESDYIHGQQFDYTRYDRLYWGKNGLYGNAGNIFNDFIDAIELDNLRLKILKSC